MTTRNQKSRNRKGRNMALESLESRQMLTAAPLVTLDQGVLTITGTELSDTIELGANRQGIHVRGVSGAFNPRDIGRIVIDAKAGDDVISLDGFGSAREAIRIPTTIHGGDGNDQIRGGDGPDEIHGGAGNDRLIGALGNDKIHGDDGNDILIGDQGDQVGLTNAPSDFRHEYARASSVVTQSVKESLEEIGTFGKGNGLQRKEPLTIGGRTETVGRAIFQALADARERLVAASEQHQRGGGDDQLFGGAGDDRIWGEGGDDVIEGGAGNDRLVGGKGDDELRGDNGADEMWGDSGVQREVQKGTLSIQELVDESRKSINKFLDQREFTDRELEDFAQKLIAEMWTDIERFFVGGGRDVVLGGAGDDTLWGEQGNDLLAGENGDDRISGGSGNDRLSGGDDDDILWGEAGADEMRGGDNTALIRVSVLGSNKKVISEFTIRESAKAIDDLTPRELRDLVLRSDKAKAASVDQNSQIEIRVEVRGDILRGGAGNDVVLGDWGDDEIHGEGGDDFLHGDSGNDLIRGGDGNDYVRGGDGVDEIYGGEGDDYLRGGDGDDMLFGNLGTDVLDGGPGKDLLAGGVDYEVDAIYNEPGDLIEDEKGVDKYTKDPEKFEKISGALAKWLAEKVTSDVLDDARDGWIKEISELEVFKKATLGVAVFKSISSISSFNDDDPVSGVKDIVTGILSVAQKTADLAGNKAMVKSLYALKPPLAIAFLALKVILILADEGPRENAINGKRHDISQAGDAAFERVRSRLPGASI